MEEGAALGRVAREEQPARLLHRLDDELVVRAGTMKRRSMTSASSPYFSSSVFAASIAL